MPLGLDTPSTFGLVFFVLRPAFLAAKQSGLDPEDAARHAWHIGMATIVTSGAFKLACAAGTGWIRRVFPRAGLLGSLTAIALVLISFLPLLELLHVPAVGFLSLAVILTTLVARLKLPGRIPGALGALLVGGVVYYGMQAAGALQPEPSPINPADALLPTEWLEAFRFEWVQSFGESWRYLPVVIPFALATIVGGIDCTESAAAAVCSFLASSIRRCRAVRWRCPGGCPFPCRNSRRANRRTIWPARTRPSRSCGWPGTYSRGET